MFHCILHQPEIPPNTGNIMRLCANTGIALHLIHPLGFALNDKQLRRAGLDYWEWARVLQYPSWEACCAQMQFQRVFACSTRGRQGYAQVAYQAGDAFLFGSETKGLPQSMLNALPSEQVIRIPMQAGNRSLNLSNAVAVILFEAWRQLDFAGGQ